jgi:hypothetical protein
VSVLGYLRAVMLQSVGEAKSALLNYSMKSSLALSMRAPVAEVE